MNSCIVVEQGVSRTHTPEENGSVMGGSQRLCLFPRDGTFTPPPPGKLAMLPSSLSEHLVSPGFTPFWCVKEVRYYLVLIKAARSCPWGAFVLDRERILVIVLILARPQPGSVSG